MRDSYKVARDLFEGWTIVFYLFFYTAVSTGYFYILSKNAPVSIIVGIFSSFVLFYSFNVINGVIKREDDEMREINNYVTTMVFHLKSGKNVLHALEMTGNKTESSVKEDIDLAILSIKKTGTLNLDSFKRHNFKTLDIFHQIVKIYDEKGGDTNKLFKKATKDINYEIGKRDELNTSKSYIVKQEFMMAGLSMAIPGVLVFMTGNVYDQFLSVGASLIVLLVFYFGLLLNLFLQQKKRSDLSIDL